MKIAKVECGSILNTSKIYGVDYAINPYIGCEHACVYCYATFMKKYTRHSEGWGEFVDIKMNAPEVLIKDLERVRRGRVLISSVTDAYQPLEEEYEITRQCLEVLSKYNLHVSILTKSPLVLRDVDILSEMNCSVGFTITTLDEGVREKFEPRSGGISARLKALKELATNGIETWAFFGPVLPFFSDKEEEIDEILTTIKEHGTSYVVVDKLNLYPRVWSRTRKLLLREYPELVPKYEEIVANEKEYKANLRAKIQNISRQGVPIELCF